MSYETAVLAAATLLGERQLHTVTDAEWKGAEDSNEALHLQRVIETVHRVAQALQDHAASHTHPLPKAI